MPNETPTATVIREMEEYVQAHDRNGGVNVEVSEVRMERWIALLRQVKEG